MISFKVDVCSAAILHPSTSARRRWRSFTSAGASSSPPLAMTGRHQQRRRRITHQFAASARFNARQTSLVRKNVSPHLDAVPAAPQVLRSFQSQLRAGKNRHGKTAVGAFCPSATVVWKSPTNRTCRLSAWLFLQDLVVLNWNKDFRSLSSRYKSLLLTGASI